MTQWYTLNETADRAETVWKVALQKKRGLSGGHQAEHEPAMCSCWGKKVNSLLGCLRMSVVIRSIILSKHKEKTSVSGITHWNGKPGEAVESPSLERDAPKSNWT